jgi:hypothetical protein
MNRKKKKRKNIDNSDLTAARPESGAPPCRGFFAEEEQDVQEVLNLVRSELEQRLDDFKSEFTVDEAEYGEGKKRHTLERILVWELIASFFFGVIGIPAIFRRNKTYALYKVFAAGIAALLIAFIGKHFTTWIFVSLSAASYLFDLLAAIVRLYVYRRGKHHSAAAVTHAGTDR